MLTQEELSRLGEVQKDIKRTDAYLASVRNSEIYKNRFRKGLSPEEKQDLLLAKEREEQLEKESDALIEERRSLIKKRDGNWKPDESSKWYPEPGYGPSW